MIPLSIWPFRVQLSVILTGLHASRKNTRGLYSRQSTLSLTQYLFIELFSTSKMYEEVFIIAPGEVMSTTTLVMLEGAKGQQVEDTGEV